MGQSPEPGSTCQQNGRGAAAQFGIEPQFEPDAGHLREGGPEVGGNTAAVSLYLLTQGSHGNQHTATTNRFYQYYTLYNMETQAGSTVLYLNNFQALHTCTYMYIDSCYSTILLILCTCTYVHVHVHTCTYIHISKVQWINTCTGTCSLIAVLLYSRMLVVLKLTKSIHIHLATGSKMM